MASAPVRAVPTRRNGDEVDHRDTRCSPGRRPPAGGTWAGWRRRTGIEPA
ncbi:hypothetical protein TOK_2393 [Pseudonocardia sp. N23]|nr:hypothetical protein TOK_2393 [Pseudonocardia sp. N23]